MTINRPIIIAACLFLALASGVFLIWPEYKKLQDKKSEIAPRQTYLQSLQEYSLELDALDIELGQYNTELSKIDSALPSEFFLPSFLNYLQRTSSDNGLILKSFSGVAASPFKEKGEIREYSLDLRLSGSYSALKNFLSVLEKSARLIEVESISFTSPEEEKPFGFSLKIKVYSY